MYVAYIKKYIGSLNRLKIGYEYRHFQYQNVLQAVELVGHN